MELQFIVSSELLGDRRILLNKFIMKDDPGLNLRPPVMSGKLTRNH